MMKLVDCFIPLLALICHFQRNPSGDGATFASQLDTAIHAARRTGHDAGYDNADIEEALFAVLALADEVALSVEWPGRAQWPRQLLQKRYFSVVNAGVAFYTKLDALNALQMQVREVYFLCLCLGFAGRYGYDRNQKALTDIKQENLKLLLQGEDGLSSEAGKLLFPDGYGAALQPHAVRQGDQDKSSRSWFKRKFSSLTLNAIMIPLGVLLVLYGIYHALVWQLVSTILPQISV